MMFFVMLYSPDAPEVVLSRTNGSNSSSIRAVTFDIWGTFLRGNRSFSRARMEILRRVLGLSATYVNRLTQSYLTVEEQANQESIETEIDIPPLARIKRTLLACGLDPTIMTDISYSAWEQIVATTRLQDDFCPQLIEDDFIDTLCKLKRSGCKIGIISNTGMDSHGVMSRVLLKLEVWQLCDAIYFSCAHGIAKPNRRLFEMAASGLDLPIGQILHVGDNVVADYQGARNAGMRSVYFYGSPKQPAPSADMQYVTALSQLPDILK